MREAYVSAHGWTEKTFVVVTIISSTEINRTPAPSFCMAIVTPVHFAESNRRQPLTNSLSAYTYVETKEFCPVWGGGPLCNKEKWSFNPL